MQPSNGPRSGGQTTPQKHSLLFRKVPMASPVPLLPAVPRRGRHRPAHGSWDRRPDADRGSVWRAPGALGCGEQGAAGRKRHTRASPDTRKGVACVLPSHRLRGLASPLMSGLQGLLSSSGLQERASRGRRLHNFPAVGEEGFEPGPWAPAAWAPWAPARRPVRRWPGSRDHPGGSRSESTAGLGLAPSPSLKQAFLASSPWQLYN